MKIMKTNVSTDKVKKTFSKINIILLCTPPKKEILILHLMTKCESAHRFDFELKIGYNIYYGVF